MNLELKHIFELIDISNSVHQPKKKIEAEKKLIELGVYNEDGELISGIEDIVKYYTENWV